MIVVENDGEVIAAKMPGKIKTFTQMFSIIFLYLNDVFFTNIHFPIGEVLLYICLFFTVYSGIDYFWNSREVFEDSFSKKFSRGEKLFLTRFVFLETDLKKFWCREIINEKNKMK